ncbi:MAG: hypothetical protein JWQ84_205 [Mucilaginibacter sp.]|nr:hypothetical protein [Mucilaginibacter sp.]MDB5015373.1 hypothetical protein [Mucilaginibacter sp.]
MTYHQYYNWLIADLDAKEKTTANQYLLLKGEKGYLNLNEITEYKKLTFDLYILMAKSEELLKLFKNGDINFNDEIDQSRLVFTVRHFS